MKYITINRKRLNAGKPAIAVGDAAGAEYCDEVLIYDHEGSVVARVTGEAMGRKAQGTTARVWIETGPRVGMVKR